MVEMAIPVQRCPVSTSSGSIPGRSCCTERSPGPPSAPQPQICPGSPARAMDGQTPGRELTAKSRNPGQLYPTEPASKGSDEESSTGK